LLLAEVAEVLHLLPVGTAAAVAVAVLGHRLLVKQLVVAVVLNQF
jgi:hypothetical protein